MEPAPGPRARENVTNAHLRDLIVLQGERVSDIGRRLDQHIEEDARRHAEERLYIDQLIRDVEGRIAVAISTHLHPFTDILPTVKKVAEERAHQERRDAAIQAGLLSIRRILVRGFTAVAAATPIAALVGHIFRWW